VKRGDTLLQSWRIRKAAPYIPSGATVLDVGCSDGALFRILKDRISSGIGIDPTAVPPDYGSFRFVRGAAPASYTALASEYAPDVNDADCTSVAASCCDCNEGGANRAISVGALAGYRAANAKACADVACTQVMSNHPTCSAAARCVNGACHLVSPAGAVLDAD